MIKQRGVLLANNTTNTEPQPCIKVEGIAINRDRVNNYTCSLVYNTFCNS